MLGGGFTNRNTVPAFMSSSMQRGLDFDNDDSSEEEEDND